MFSTVLVAGIAMVCAAGSNPAALVTKEVKRSQIRLVYRNKGLIEIPGEVFKETMVSRIVELDVGGNNIRSVPPEIGNLQWLTWLYLNNNKILCLPEEIKKLAFLDELDVSNNEIAWLPIEIGELRSLEKLNVSNNKLRRVAVKIGKMKSLRELSLGGNALCKLPRTLRGLRNLKKIDLSNNLFEDIPEVLGSLECLEVLNMRGNRIKRVGRRVAEALLNSKTLSLIDLQENDLADESTSEWVGWKELEMMFEKRILLSKWSNPSACNLK